MHGETMKPSAYVPSLTSETKFHPHTRNNSTLTIKATGPVIRHMCVMNFIRQEPTMLWAGYQLH